MEPRDSEVRMGKGKTNKTGAAMSPMDSAQSATGAVDRLDSNPAKGAEVMSQVRGFFIEASEPIGSVPPPASLKGAGKTVVAKLKGTRAEVLLDRLGQRLAFERTGVRLYEGLITKFENAPLVPEDMTLEMLERIRDDEAAHFALVKDAIQQMGGDPTAMTPAADVAGVTAMGIIQVVSDPRTTLLHSLEAILSAELTDNAAWELLIEVANELGQDDLVAKFTEALATEQVHLERVESWILSLTLANADGEA